MGHSLRGAVGVIGREPELADLIERVQGSIPVLVEGDAGIGKSAVLAELAVRLEDDGHAVARVFASEVTTPLPLFPFSELLGEARMTDQPAQLVVDLLATITRRGREDHLVLLVDDVQHLDRTSLAVVHQVITRQAAPIVFARRSTDALPAALQSLIRERRVQEIELTGLDVQSTAVLAEALGGAPIDNLGCAALVRWTAGNPLFIRELMAVGLESGCWRLTNGTLSWIGTDPSGDLRHLIAGRIDGLSTPERKALVQVSLFDGISRDVLSRSVDRSTLQGLEDRRLLRVEGRGNRMMYVLTHPLFGEAVRRGMARTEAKTAYEAYADSLAQTLRRRADDVLQFGVASVRAGRTGDVPALLAAAAIAQARGAAQLVLEVAQPAQLAYPTVIGAAMCGAALINGGHIAEGNAAFETGIYADGDDMARTMLAVSWAIGLFESGSNPAAALGVIARFEPLVQSSWRHELTAIETMVECYSGSLDKAIACVDRVLGSDDAPERARFWTLLPGTVAHAFAGRAKDAERFGDVIRSQAASYGTEIPFVVEQVELVCALVDCAAGHALRAAEDMRASISRSVALNNVAGLMFPEVGVAFAEWYIGMPSKVPDWRDTTRPEFLSAEFLFKSWAVAFVSATQARFGSLDLARSVAGEFGQLHQSRLLSPVAEFARAEIAFAEGNLREGIAALDRAIQLASNHGAWHMIAFIELRRAGLIDSKAAIDRAASAARRFDGWLGERFQRAGAAVADGSHKSALDVVEELAEHSYRPAALDVINAVTLRCRNTTILQRANALRATVQGGVRVGPAIQTVRLTESERRVADLVSEGRSNKEVADDLFVSARTVEFHLSSIYRKLGVARRTEMVRVLRDMPT
jgi:DNA-binding CsgD family transcriptional regulator